MSEVVHLLRDKWFVSFLPLITKEQIQQEFNGDWNRAAESKTRRMDFITSVEELWSTMNSLPHICQLPVGSTYLFSRLDKPTTYEAYPNGIRVTLKLFSSPACNKGVDILLALILGESLPECAGGSPTSEEGKDLTNSYVPVCDLVRLCGRQSKEFPNSVQAEVWLNDKSYSDGIVEAICETFKVEEIPENTYSIVATKFDSGSSCSSV